MSTIYFIEAIKQKLFELTFLATPRSTQTVQDAVDAQALEIQSMQSDVSTNSEDMQWVEALLGEYQNDVLGHLKIQKSNGSYRLVFEEWETRIGCHIEEGTKKIITILDGPAPGFVKLQVRENQLILDDGQQTTYCFNKVQYQLNHQGNSSSWIKYGLFGAATVGALVASACVLYSQSNYSNGM